MYLQKVISKKTLIKTFVGILKATDEKSRNQTKDPDLSQNVADPE
jgi:hypothetical protein